MLFMTANLILISQLLFAQSQTVGLFVKEQSSFSGYTLWTPLFNTTTYLVDHDGMMINSWENQFRPANSVYLLENGNLHRTTDPGGNGTFIAGGDGGLVEEFDWDGNLVWQFLYSNEQYRQHHDIAPLPNGNVLILAWEYRSGDEAIAAGRDSASMDENELWPEHIVEIEPVGSDAGNIVWEWHVWDHLIQDNDSTKGNFGVVAEHPELIDINFVRDNRADWLHANAIDYNPDLDQIILTIPFWNEFWVIDHSTTSAEAAFHSGGRSGKGGDILYRWGNPQTYRAGNAADQKFYTFHDAHWIKPGYPGEGNIMVFHNGRGRPAGNFSTVEEIIPPVDNLGNYVVPDSGRAFGPEESQIVYRANPSTDFYSSFISGSQRLPNGNTLICDGAHGTFFEVNQSQEIVWKYISPVTDMGRLTQGDIIPLFGNRGLQNAAFRVSRYAPDYPGLTDKDLTPKGPIELDPTNVDDSVHISLDFNLAQNYPNPFNPSTTIRFTLPEAAEVTLRIFNVLGEEVAVLISDQFYNAGVHSIKFNATKPSSGLYLYQIQIGSFVSVRKMMIVQ